MIDETHFKGIDCEARHAHVHAGLVKEHHPCRKTVTPSDSGTICQWAKVANIHLGVQNSCMTDVLRIDILHH
jgi:hypothetical protein